MNCLFHSCFLISLIFSVTATNQVDVLCSIFSISDSVTESLNSLGDDLLVPKDILPYTGYNPLFARFQNLRYTIPYISFASLPTPIDRAYNLEAKYSNKCAVYIKRDDLVGKFDSEPVFCGGNKVRKLEYLLADAISQGYLSVMTFGAAGSNHALQTSICADKLGMSAICLLFPQPVSWVVQRNLLLHSYYETVLYYCTNRDLRGIFAAAICYDQKQRYGSFPYVIPFGGSCEVGIIGYVQAAFELADQIEIGLIEEPDDIYVTFGSGGTAIGLLLGLQAAGINSHIHMIVEEPADSMRLANKIERLFYGTNKLLYEKDKSFPRLELDCSRYTLVLDCGGKGYGIAAQESLDAEEILLATENIRLDQTYTAKAFSALIRDLDQENCFGKTILFWNTFCAEPFEQLTQQIDSTNLLHGLQHYFESEVELS